jgi:hypothetical protein
MTKQDLRDLLEACRTTPAMFLSGGTPMFDTPQENANRAWQGLAARLARKRRLIDSPCRQAYDGPRVATVHPRGSRP